MTVFDLIHALMMFNPEATVLTEGCDCIGRACGVRVPREGEYIPEQKLELEVAAAPVLYVLIERGTLRNGGSR